MVVFRRAVAAGICLIFANRLSHLTGSTVIAPGDPGYEFGATTSSLLTHAYYLTASLFWLVASVIAICICLAFEPPHIKRPGFIILGILGAVLIGLLLI